jgi:hypothetical protein
MDGRFLTLAFMDERKNTFGQDGRFVIFAFRDERKYHDASPSRQRSMV